MPNKYSDWNWIDARCNEYNAHQWSSWHDPAKTQQSPWLWPGLLAEWAAEWCIESTYYPSILQFLIITTTTMKYYIVIHLLLDGVSENVVGTPILIARWVKHPQQQMEPLNMHKQGEGGVNRSIVILLVAIRSLIAALQIGFKCVYIHNAKPCTIISPLSVIIIIIISSHRRRLRYCSTNSDPLPYQLCFPLPPWPN